MRDRRQDTKVRKVAILASVILLAGCSSESRSPVAPALASGAYASRVATYDCTAQSDIPAAECQALVDLYTDTNGPGWTNSTGWLQTATPCAWYGVSCFVGSVIGLVLEQNNLIGQIPASLGSLANLGYLDLQLNNLSGAIPSSLGSLGSLSTLVLGFNQLSGPIPASLGSLANLRGLYLNTNQLSGSIPPSLGALTLLWTLNLGQNRLTGPVPSSLGTLTNLTTLGRVITDLKLRRSADRNCTHLVPDLGVQIG